MVLNGHEGTVWSLAFVSPEHLVSGSDDCTARIWHRTESSTVKCQAVLRGHNGAVWAVVALGNEIVASGSSDETVRIWSLDGQCQAVLRGHTDIVHCLLSLGDGRLASGSSDETVRIWKVNAGSKTAGSTSTTVECEQVLRRQGSDAGSVSSLAICGNYIASGWSDNTVGLWQPGEPWPGQVLRGHTKAVTSVVGLGDGRLASGSVDRTIRIWDTDFAIGSKSKHSDTVHKGPGPVDTVYALANLGNGTVAAASADRMVFVFKPEPRGMR